ncbi:MAG: serine/threonine-protein kinase [Acidobacteria bacterium]|nr:serine/threonine-protein kinase [Acidobacteriota bacterium]
MTLPNGSNLGPYQIVSRLGAGGMGEVYRALDTRLDRSVAVKVLPSDTSGDEKANARFQREAKLISQLSHPNICALYDIGRSNETTYIVMELIDGETLGSRLQRGPLPLREIFPCAIQIADALDRAHRTGVIHRDLKPGNVMLTRGGAKLLDFGLARAINPVVAEDDPTQAAPLTSAGMVVGTLPYMAPEQLHGRETDERSDIFAFGALLYEMITGRRAFHASSSASLVAQILEHEPPAPSSLQPITPAALERVVMTCLEKDPERRFQCAGDLARELRRIETGTAIELETATTIGPLKSRPMLYGLIAAGVVVALAAAVAGFLAGRQGTDPAPRATFTQLTFGSGEELHPTISPDGRMFAYVKRADGQRDIFLQRTGGSSAINLTEGNQLDDEAPAFSPDGNLIAFRSDRDGGGIFVMGATGESVRRLTESGFNPAWSPDGSRIVYSTERTGTPRTVYGGGELWTVELGSGRSERLFEGPALQPSWSPDGRRIAFWAGRSGGHRDIFLIDATGEPESLVNVTADAHLDWNPVWSPDGTTLYFSSERNGTMNLWRVAIDQTSGKPAGAVEPLNAASPDASSISISGDGTRILYRSTSHYGTLERIRFDATTETVEGDGVVFDGSLPIRNAAASPDGSWIAFSTSGIQEDVYVMAADGTDVRQLTSDASRDRGISWWPDGSRIVFYSNRTGTWQGWTIRPDGSGLEQLTEMAANWPRISRDGTRVTFVGENQGIVAELATLPVSEGRPLPRVEGSSFAPATWSPDGTKVAGAPWGSVGTYIYSPTIGPAWSPRRRGSALSSTTGACC